MKKYVYLALALVLTTSMLVGCGCTNRKGQDMSQPTVLPTNEEIWDRTETTVPPTRESTAPSTMTTTPNETHDRGNGPLEDITPPSSGSMESTAATDNAQSRARGAMPGMR